MSDTQRGLTRWRYWAARAADRNGDTQLARQLYESTLTDDNFYSIAAASRLGQTLAPHPERLVVDEVQLKQIEQLPALLRARELFRSEMRDLAGQEWAYGFEMLPQTARPQAVQLASRWGWHDQAIAVAAQQRLFNDYELLYPQPFDRQVRAAAQLSEAAARAHLQRDAAGKSVSRRCDFFGGRARSAPDGPRHGASNCACIQATETDAR